MSTALEDAEKRGVGIGMAIAAGIIMASWGDETHARAILEAAGFNTIADLQNAGVDAYDINLLLPALDDDSVEMIEIDGRRYRKFIRHPEEIHDGTLRCISCGQIDDEPWHDMIVCSQAWADGTEPRAEASAE